MWYVLLGHWPSQICSHRIEITLRGRNFPFYTWGKWNPKKLSNLSKLHRAGWQLCLDLNQSPSDNRAHSLYYKIWPVPQLGWIHRSPENVIWSWDILYISWCLRISEWLTMQMAGTIIMHRFCAVLLLVGETFTLKADTFRWLPTPRQ